MEAYLLKMPASIPVIFLYFTVAHLFGMAYSQSTGGTQICGTNCFAYRSPRGRPPPKKSRRQSSDEEEVSAESASENSDSDYAGKKSSRRQPARNQTKLPPRRSASKPVTYSMYLKALFESFFCEILLQVCL